MRLGLLLLFVLLFAPPPAEVQDSGGPNAHPFSISSLNTAFGMQGEFEGEYRVYPDRIELRVTKANIHISEHCPYKGRRLLSALNFGLAAEAGGGRWKVDSWGQEFPLEQVMSPGETHSLGELYFHIPRGESADLSKHWLVVQMEDIALDVPDEKRRKGYAFAQSCRDIFTRGK